MGGQSHSSFAQEGGVGNFTGLCAIVPFLKAPGFCKIGTTHGLLSPPGFADASAFIGGSLYITAKSSTPSYKGFKVDFGAKNVTRPRPGMHHGPPSFKADFTLPASAAADFDTVKIPFSDFSVDWSDYTGECDTKDHGEQHVCCSTRTRRSARRRSTWRRSSPSRCGPRASRASSASRSSRSRRAREGVMRESTFAWGSWRARRGGS